MGCTLRGSNPGTGKRCSLLQKCPDRSWIHPASYSLIFFLIWRNGPPVGQGLIHEVSRSGTTHHSRQDSSGRVISSSQRPLLDNTQHSQQTDIHAPGGNQTHNPSKRAAADPRLRPSGHWDRRRKRLKTYIGQFRHTNICKEWARKTKTNLSLTISHRRFKLWNSQLRSRNAGSQCSATP